MRLVPPVGAIVARVRQMLVRLDRLDRLTEAIGRIEARQVAADPSDDLNAHEFRVFSQNGEDGVIQFLLSRVTVEKELFVEFGVGDYSEANTRFLSLCDHWSGLVIEGNPRDVTRLKRDSTFWRFDLTVVSAFITRENINDLLADNGMTGDIGLLSIDVDGNDYWIFEAISVIRPAIVIIEYNHRFGPDRAVTVPYDPAFSRDRAHFSHIYYGASLRAMCLLADRKGYAFVGCESFGVNAFFVRRDLMTDRIRELSVAEGYRRGRFRAARDRGGRLAYLTAEEEAAILADMPVVDVA
jgi:Methyltransferase FkbM domain